MGRYSVAQRWLRGAVVLGLGGSFGCSGDDGEAGRDVGQERFDRVVEMMRADHVERNVPGGAIAVVIDGELRYTAGVGVKAAGGADPVTADTVFRVASVTKMHVAFAALALAEEGKLDLEAPVTDHVPELGLLAGHDPAAITAHHLMAHTSGLPDRNPLTVPDGWLKCPNGVDALSQHFANAEDQPLWSKPGELYNYSNQGYSVLGLLVERAGGAPFDEVVRQRVFVPGKLGGHTFDIAQTMAGDHALGHQASGGQLSAPFEPDVYQCGVDRPAADLMTSARGLGKLAELLLAEGAGVVSPESYAKMRASHTPTRVNGSGTYGYGLSRNVYKGLEYWGHGGEYYGYRTQVVVVPDKSFGVAVVENRAPGAPWRVVSKALDVFLELEHVTVDKETKTAAELAAYTGVYLEPYQFGNVVVTPLGEDLEISILNGALKFPAYYAGGDTVEFVFQGTDGTATFWPGPSGSFDIIATRAGVGRRVVQ